MKTQVKFDLGYIPLFFTELWAFFKVIAHLAGASVSYGHISSFLLMSSLTLRWRFENLVNK